MQLFQIHPSILIVWGRGIKYKTRGGQNRSGKDLFLLIKIFPMVIFHLFFLMVQSKQDSLGNYKPELFMFYFTFIYLQFQFNSILTERVNFNGPAHLRSKWTICVP